MYVYTIGIFNEDTRSVQQSEQTHNEEQVNASSEQPAVAKSEGATGKETKYGYLNNLYY